MSVAEDAHESYIPQGIDMGIDFNVLLVHNRCTGYKAFLTHVNKLMRIMAELLWRNRAPAEVMLVSSAKDGQFQKAFNKVGRIELCP
jgi:hypothetical protein